VQLTRYPEGLASALEKISLSPTPLRHATPVTAPMYITNPFGGKKSFWASMGSTHPPTEERIRILRGMGGGASIMDYQRAFQQAAPANRRNSLFSEKVIGANANIPARGASLVQPAVDHREVGDALWQQNGYKIIDCDCGTRLKIPPKFQYKMAGCPHCHKNHEIPA
jgi:heat shock protein HtpX